MQQRASLGLIGESDDPLEREGRRQMRGRQGEEGQRVEGGSGRQRVEGETEQDVKKHKLNFP